jgi:UTP--glucose-1-phosphate uridylyltransferase
LLEHTERGAGGEIQLTDGIAALLKQESVLAYEFTGRRYDCGSKFGWLQANIDFALKDLELKDQFSTYIQDKARTLAL